MENVFEQLISTLERNAENDKVEISGFKVWAERWSVEYRGMLEDLIAETDLEEHSAEVKLASIRNLFESWIKAMEREDFKQLFMEIKSASEGNGL